MSAPVLVTGAAGFLGMHLCRSLLDRGSAVVGVDDFNAYYDPSIKERRRRLLEESPNFTMERLDVSDADGVRALFDRHRFRRVAHLAAQAGVRYSLQNPGAYVQANLVAFGHILEACRKHKVAHLLYASSSSVYGANAKTPFSESDQTDEPVSLYAATKKANELMAHSYSHLYGLPTTGLRFFTVYGPWGRPDMAYFKFTKAISEGRPIDVYNHGNMRRDFAYVDDIVEGVVRVMERTPSPDRRWSGDHPDPASSYAPYTLYNIGNNNPVDLLRFIEVLEGCLGRKAIKNLLPLQPGDVLSTYADVDDLIRDVGFKPETPIEVGLEHFVGWYRSYYGRNEDHGQAGL